MSETEDELPASECARCQMETPVACVWLEESDCLFGLKKRFERGGGEAMRHSGLKRSQEALRLIRLAIWRRAGGTP